MINTYEREYCPECNSSGRAMYSKMSDRLFGAPGEWDLNKCVNPECAVMWLSPLPVEEEIYKAYETYYTHVPERSSHSSRLADLYRQASDAYYSVYFKYPKKDLTRLALLSAKILRLIPRRAAHLDFLAFHLEYEEHGTLLEVGCGGGNHLLSMQELGWTVKGIDIDPKAVQACQELGLPAENTTIEQLADRSEKFDAVVMSHVIEHVYDPRKMIEDAYKLLKPGGKLVLITPNNESFSEFVFGRNWLELDPPRHLVIFNMRSLKNLMTSVGFNTVADTSIRFSDGAMIASLSILRQGKATMNRHSRLLGWVGKIYQILHFILYRISKRFGEELVMIGTKKIE